MSRISQVMIGVATVSSFACSDDGELERRRRQMPLEVQVPVVANAVPNGTEIESTVLSDHVEAGAGGLDRPKGVDAKVDATDIEGDSTSDGQTFRLAVLPARKRSLPPQLIVRSTAQFFHLNVLWVPPAVCTAAGMAVRASQCTDAAKEDFCKGGLLALNKLYCGLGGSSREEASYLGARFTAGDVVVLFQAAATICSMKNPDADVVGNILSLAGKELGHGYNKSKALIADQMITRILGIPADSGDGLAEFEFITNELFGPTVNAQTELFTGDTALGRRELFEKFSRACTYLVTHPRLMTY